MSSPVADHLPVVARTAAARTDSSVPAPSGDAVPVPGTGPAGVRLARWALHLPDSDALAADLADWSGVAARPLFAALRGAVPADRAREVLGPKGLLAKEPATRLALCAVHRAFGLPRGRPAPVQVDPGVAVVVASNLGNVATVADVIRTVRHDGGRAVSPLTAPNASSNVVASTIALWYGFGGPNLMICSGSTAGLDAIHTAARLLRARRATRVIVVGVEPADEVATDLHRAGRPAAPLRAGAACLVLTAEPDVAEPTVWPETGPPAPYRLGPDGFDPAARWGDCYGAAGVVNVALAATLLAAGAPGPVSVGCGDDIDGRRAVRLDEGRRADR